MLPGTGSGRPSTAPSLFEGVFDGRGSRATYDCPVQGVRIGFLALVLSGAVALTGCGGSKTTAVPATTSAAHHYHHNMYRATWSPDGTQIAWAEGRGGPKSWIWIASSNGSNAHRVTQFIDALFQFAWLPGNQLLYDANFRLFRLPLRTLRPDLLDKAAGDSFTTNGAGTIIAWGTPICPLCGGPITVRSLVGGQPTLIGGRKVQNYSPTLSPDGRLVAFSRTFWSKAGGEYYQPAGIWVSSTTGGPLKRLTRSGSSPSWSPDGRRLVYVDGFNLRLVSASGGSKVLLLRRNASNNLATPPTWSPDSRSVAVVSTTGSSPGRLFVVSVATHQVKAVTGTAIGSVSGFAWSPNSTTLLVTAQSKTDCSILWAVNVSGSAERLRRTALDARSFFRRSPGRADLTLRHSVQAVFRNVPHTSTPFSALGESMKSTAIPSRSASTHTSTISKGLFAMAPLRRRPPWPFNPPQPNLRRRPLRLC